MKVLHCFRRYLPTTENWAFKILENLIDVEVVITSPAFLKNNFYNSRFRYIEFPIDVFQHPTNKRKLFIRILNFIILQVRKLYPRYVCFLAKDVDILHSHFAPMAWKFHPIALKLRVPHVISFYGYDYEKLLFINPEWKEKYKVLFKEADMFICEGNHGAKIILQQGCPSEKISTIRLGVNVNEIPFIKRNKRKGELKLLQIASFTEKKGHYYTVAAFIKTLETCPEMHLTLVGGDKDGVSRKRVLELIEESHSGNKITLLESIDFSRLYNFMEDYQVFIHPSCYASDMDCEGGAPVVLLDAQATGMPVIATTHCDIPDEVIDKTTGLLSPEKDIEALSESIKTFYNMDEATYNKYSFAARKHVEENFDASKNSKHLREIYRKLLLKSQ
ncbi:MAG TPA: glycosyltransferase family 4 protein [Cytophagales bacterium]|nr:glycosyltransferase family 4 protein [Cytophagales bacterium]